MRTRLGEAFEQLSAERDRLERVLEQMNEGVLAVDRGLHVQFANANAKLLLAGVPLEKGAPLPDTHGGLPLRRLAEGLFAPRASVAEARSQREDGAMISLVGVPASSSDLVVLVFADITEQERRRQAEREFVTNASHELRTPVTAITSAVEALQSGAKDDPERRERFIELIGRQATRLTRLSSSLLILARAQTKQENLHLEPVELGGLLKEIAAASVPADGVSLRVECPRPVVAVGQRDIVEQVVANLVGNAVKHTVEGEIVLRAAQDGAGATIEVADTGPGISPTVAGPRLRPLLQRRAERPRRLRARPRDRARVGRGDRRRAHDRVRVGPRHDRARRPSGREARMTGAHPARRRRARHPRPGQLRARAARVRGDVRRDGDAALERARSGEFDLLLCDVMMPGTLGTDVCRILRAESDLPIILLTAKDAEVDRVLGLELGADDYITKPFSSSELVSRVRALLRRRELDRKSASAATKTAGGLRIDYARHVVEVDGKQVKLTPSEFNLLSLLAEEPERVFSRAQIMDHLWQTPHVGDPRACDVHISNLRRKIERDPGTRSASSPCASSATSSCLV